MINIMSLSLLSKKRCKNIFKPSDLPNLALWLDASDASTITESSGSVSEWRDKSGLNNHATQATALSQPTTGVRTINGNNVLTFDGISNYLNSAIVQTGSNNVGLYVVLRNVTPNDYTGRIFTQKSGTGTRSGIWIDGTVGTAFNNANTYNPTSVTYQQGVHSLIGYRNGATVGLGYDGAMTTAEKGTDIGVMDSAYIGSYSYNRDLFNGDIAEIVLDLDYSESTRTNMLAYFDDKWGV